MTGEPRCFYCNESAGASLNGALVLYEFSDGVDRWAHTRCAERHTAMKDADDLTERSTGKRGTPGKAARSQ